MAKEADKELVEFIGSYPQGINSDLDPLLLPKNQLAYARNGTVRGNFFKSRPPYRKINLTFTNPTVQQNFQTGLFQGASYFAPDSGAESIAAAISGQLFQITPNTGNGAAVGQVALPDAGNPANLTEAWLWQSERWLIWNDSQSVPMFYDGNTARRSMEDSANALAITSTSFFVPSPGQQVIVGTNQQYSGALGIPILINGASYNLVNSYNTTSIGLGRYPITLDTVQFTVGDLLAPGASFSTNNKFCGIITGAVDENNNAIATWPTYSQIVSAVDGSGNAITVWPPMPSGGQITGAVDGSGNVITTWPPMPVPAGTGTPATPATSFNITFPASTVWNPTYNFQTSFAGMSVGDTIKVNGYPCTVNSLTYYQGNSNLYLTGAICTPQTTAATGQPISSTVTPQVHTECGQTLNGVCQYYISTNSAAFQGSGVGTMNGGTPAIPGGAAVPNYFTLTLIQPYSGAIGSTLQIGSVLMTVTAKSGNTVTCQMQNNTFQGQVIPMAVLNYFTLTLIAPYTGAVGSTLIIGSAVMTVTNIAGNTVTCQMNSNTYQGQVIPETYMSYFTLALTQSFSGTIGDILQVGMALMTVTTVNGNQVTCQMNNNAYQGQAIPIPTGAITYSQLVIDTSANGSLTVVASYPLDNGATPTPVNNTNLTITNGMVVVIQPSPSSPPVVGQILQATNTAGTIDYFQIATVGWPITPGQSYVVVVENINDTVGTVVYNTSGQIVNGNVVQAGSALYPIPELPTGKMGVYGMGRNWLCLPDGKSFIAGDLVGGSSGSDANNYRDAVLKVSENTLLAGGGNFVVPGNVGEIRSMQFLAVLDASLGQGAMQVGTDKNIFSCNAPVDRTTWQSMTTPILGESLKGVGTISQHACSLASGDLLFRASDGTIRSLLMARLDFNEWGNTPISQEMDRLLLTENKTLLGFDSSCVFDNRFLMAANPAQSALGVYFTSIIALNFDPISSLRGKADSVYDGEWTGLNVLRFIVDPDGNAPFFGGVQRCLALCLSADLTTIELHEILANGQESLDDGSNQIIAYFESATIFGMQTNKDHDYLRLKYGEIYIDGLTGDVHFQVYYRPDQWPNWILWHEWTQTFVTSTDPGFRPRIGLPMPSKDDCDTVNNRPLREGYGFQIKLVATLL